MYIPITCSLSIENIKSYDRRTCSRSIESPRFELPDLLLLSSKINHHRYCRFIGQSTTVPVFGCRIDPEGGIQDRHRGEGICDLLSKAFQCDGCVTTGWPVSLICSTQSFQTYPERGKVNGRKVCLIEGHAFRKCKRMK